MGKHFVRGRHRHFIVSEPRGVLTACGRGAITKLLDHQVAQTCYTRLVQTLQLSQSPPACISKTFLSPRKIKSKSKHSPSPRRLHPKLLANFQEGSKRQIHRHWAVSEKGGRMPVSVEGHVDHCEAHQPAMRCWPSFNVAWVSQKFVSAPIM